MNELPIKRLLWPVPVLLMIHNCEEAWTMPLWVEKNYTLLVDTISLFGYLKFSAPQLYASLATVTIVPFIIVAIMLSGSPTKRKVTVVLILQSIIFWNALIPHAAGVFVLGMYNPGTVTAVLINIPFSLFLFRNSAIENVYSKKETAAILLTGLISYLPLVYLNHLIARSFVSLILPH